jgi:hypothetical protein
MKKQERENTIVVWSEQKDLRRTVTEYCNAHDIEICFPSTVTEALAIPNFLFFIDLDNFNSIIKSGYFWLSDYLKEHKNKFVIYTYNKKCNISEGFEKQIEVTPFIISKKYIAKVISGGIDRLQTEDKIRNLEFNNKVFRIIFLYKMLDHGEPIKTKEICKRFKISERTLRRDIKILREVDLERPIYFDPEEGYFI